MKDQWSTFHKLVIKGNFSKGFKPVGLELKDRRPHGHGDWTCTAHHMRDVKVAILIVRGREHVDKAIPHRVQRWPGAGLSNCNSTSLPMLTVIPSVDPLVLVLASTIAIDAHLVQHGLPIHPVNELVIAKLKFCWSSVYQATLQPSRDRALHAQCLHAELFGARLEPPAEVDAHLVGTLRPILRRHARDELLSDWGDRGALYLVAIRSACCALRQRRESTGTMPWPFSRCQAQDAAGYQGCTDHTLLRGECALVLRADGTQLSVGRCTAEVDAGPRSLPESCKGHRVLPASDQHFGKAAAQCESSCMRQEGAPPTKRTTLLGICEGSHHR
mmetsp:Transcript_35851/g.78495  ORF Transcript_35851/g.78495 Transcript_35851/m.78495 type:complete len:330 (-) Transcript_35851:14-1003(-)